MLYQFFHEVAETEPWMLDEMSSLSTCLDELTLQSLNEQDSKAIEDKLQVWFSISIYLGLEMFRKNLVFNREKTLTGHIYFHI